MELKVALSSSLKTRRSESGLSQEALAKKLGSSQSRVAKMEASDPTVSVDLLIRGLLATGASKKDIASAIAGAKPKQVAGPPPEQQPITTGFPRASPSAPLALRELDRLRSGSETPKR